ncbi:unnamed protein product [Pleuronectes platessa]|uniref:Uncharacterized protein n=1 Tax=Pleuronectes platessa TaxID=8262 RepID=A0A9N7YV52_PLEPL|nr:unnamed protein product [Pleuronectes platessa]
MGWVNKHWVNLASGGHTLPEETGLLSSISVFKQDKVPVHITDLSLPDSPTCHSPGDMKASSFCLKVGDEKRTAVRDLAGLTDWIRPSDPRKRGGGRCSKVGVETLVPVHVRETGAGRRSG